MSKTKELLNKSISTLKDEGIISFIKKAKNYTSKQKNKDTIKYCKDFLFINGCTLPHPQRYRISHQREQLESNNLSTDEVFYEDLNIDMQKYYRGFVFFRCPVTEIVKEFIKKAKENNKTIFYDIDDLVFDKKYTKDIEYLNTLSKEEYDLYYDGVKRMQETLKLCDYATTTTEALADELKYYVKEVYINRNRISEKMAEYSLKALKTNIKEETKKYIGYLSGSITHNKDFEMILPAISRIMKENINVYLKVVGYLDIPKELETYKDRIIFEKFVDWKNLPKIIASLDINLAPLEDSLFNRAKSENKWTEAALVNVPTIASNVGAFKTVINNNIDGILVDNNDEDWYNSLNKLLCDEKLRTNIGIKANQRIMKEYITTYSGYNYKEFMMSKLNKSIAFVLPSTNISGGVNVVIKHCNILKKHGYDVFIINLDDSSKNVINSDGEIDVLSSFEMILNCHITKMVATLWTTLYYILGYHKVKDKLYLVQNFETNFMNYGNYAKQTANSTYCFDDVKYITISKWCKKWLEEDYKRTVKYAPNGLNTEKFYSIKRNTNGKIKILVEGNSNDFYKNVDESFKIVDKLDKTKFEIWYLSYQGKPKNNYYCDKFFCKVPYDKVDKIYRDCDILIKSSLLESFSYPPLEMMSTGGACVVVPNDGNIEYLENEKNCLFYAAGNIDEAVEKINLLTKNKELKEKLFIGGVETSKKYEWNNITNKILKLYED